MPIRHSPPRNEDAKAKRTQNKERPVEVGDGKRAPVDVADMPPENKIFPPHQAPHIQAPPEILNAPAAPLSPPGTHSSTDSPVSDPLAHQPSSPVAHAWHGNGFNIPIAGIEDSAGASAEATTEAKATATIEPGIEASPKQGIITVGGIDFHHASEAEFARLLDYYGIDWQYEPNQFPLQWRDGHPVEMFRPDFYLPEYDLYIELTTMRQALVRRKNRKLRLLRALYPEINIKLLYRRDYQRLLERFGIKPEEIEAEAPLALQELQDEDEAEPAHRDSGPQMRQDDIA
ncbi:MAG TPA: hypothetical protein VGE04_07750 [Chloroflexia bacterium]